MFWNKEEWGERPFPKNPLKYAGHHFMGQKVPYRTRWTEDYYSLKERIQFAHTTQNMLEKTVSWDRARLEDFVADDVNMTLSSLEPSLARLDGIFANEGERLGAIYHDPSLTAAQKEEFSENYYRERNAEFKQYSQEVNEVLTRVEKEQQKALKQLEK